MWEWPFQSPIWAWAGATGSRVEVAEPQSHLWHPRVCSPPFPPLLHSMHGVTAAWQSPVTLRRLCLAWPVPNPGILPMNPSSMPAPRSPPHQPDKPVHAAKRHVSSFSRLGCAADWRPREQPGTMRALRAMVSTTIITAQQTDWQGVLPAWSSLEL